MIYATNYHIFNHKYCKIYHQYEAILDISASYMKSNKIEN